MSNNEKPNLKIGQKLVLILDNEKVVGTLFKLKETHLRLKDVHDYITKEYVGANCIYYTNLIRSIKILDQKIDQKPTSNGTSKANGVENTELKHKAEAAKMPLETIDHIYDLLQHFIYINIFDQKYFNAVKVLAEQRVIAVNIENVENGRKSVAPSVLSIATEHQIYLFDLMSLNGVAVELRAILTANRPMKVIHHSKYILDYLRNNTGTTVISLFDTMVSCQVSLSE